MTCLDKIIGLSRTECECLLENLPGGSDEISDYNESLSGLFMDELDGFNITVASGAEDCANGGIWEMMARSLEIAKTDYKNEMLGCLGTQFKPRINNFTAQLGQSTFKGNANPNTAYAGFKISPVQMKGGYIIVKKIGIIVTQAVPVTVEIYSNEPGDDTNSTLIYSSTPIVGVANTLKWATLTTPLELPMFSKNKSHLHYYALILLDGTFLPKKNKESCGCNGKTDPYKQFMNISGTKGNDIGDLDSYFQSTEELNGLVLDVEVKCKTSEIICSEQYPPDYENDGNALNMAYAIRYRADARLYEMILASDNINRFTLLNRDYIEKKKDEWNDKFKEWVSYACLNSNNLYENDCLLCRDTKTTLKKRGINVYKKHH